MDIAGQGISFHPLYWMFHDQWTYYAPNDFGPPATASHYGHMHFWMMGFDWSSDVPGGGDAFTGLQRYKFELQDIWGPRSQDPNQTYQYTVIGKPKWYFHTTELWRRVYIQKWDAGDQRGIRFEASPADKRMGPFREGRSADGQTSWAPYWSACARTLPLEHFTTGDHVQARRDNWVNDLAQVILPPDQYLASKYDLQHGNYLLAANYYKGGGHPAGVPAFSDALYVWPIIEYQKIVQLDWEPLPGSTPDVTNLDDATSDYGDGWTIETSVPFIDPVARVYRSPFANSPGFVLPFGQYNEGMIGATPRQLVPTGQRSKYGKTSYDVGSPYRSPIDLPPGDSEQPIQWHNPYPLKTDGKVVQQCLGGLVQAKARVIIEHKLGGRQEVWTETTQYIPSTPFEGTDQGAPPQGS